MGITKFLIAAIVFYLPFKVFSVIAEVLVNFFHSAIAVASESYF